jgi:hypothetical protein
MGKGCCPQWASGSPKVSIDFARVLHRRNRSGHGPDAPSSSSLAPVNHLSYPQGRVRLEPDAVRFPTLLSESKRYVDGSRSFGSGKSRCGSTLACFDQDRTQTPCHDAQTLNSAPRSYYRLCELVAYARVGRIEHVVNGPMEFRGT